MRSTGLSRRSTRRAGALIALVLCACSASDRPPSPLPAPAPAASTAAHVAAVVAHRDPRLGLPSFVWIAKEGLPRFTSPKEAATATLEGLARTFTLSDAALASLSTPEIHDVGAGAILARVHQRVAGVEVFRGTLSIAMTRAFEPVAASGLVAPDVPRRLGAFSLAPRAALDVAARAMATGPMAFAHLDEADEYARFSAPGLFQPARVKKVLFPTGAPGAVTLAPAYYVEIMLASGPARSFVVAADDGRVLFDNDLVRNDAFTYRVYATDGTNLPADGPQGNGYAPHPTGKPDRTKPVFGPSKLVTLDHFPFSKDDPWLFDGATETSGNNVNAYADLTSPDGFTSSSSDVHASTTAPSTFDWTYDTTKSPGATPENVSASVTQLFYDFNFLHDWYYDAGFDEKSGNHQLRNYGRGGRERDPLRAEAQDYGGRNNSDAATPADGASPRIQMYVFSGVSEAELEVTAPASIAGEKPAGLAAFGDDTYDLTGAVVLADDGDGTDPHDACEALGAEASGKIVLAHRGQCQFGQKAQNAQAAGALAIIVTNVPSSPSPSTPPTLGGSGDGVTIPAIGVALADGQAIEGAIPSGVTVTMKRSAPVDLDGGLDTSIVAHEWGHVLSNRLVANGNGLRANQAGGLGEGWGDFSALLVLARADDLEAPGGANWAGAYTNGAYAESGIGDIYFGTRRVPYSVDFSKDPLTFKHIQNGTPLPANVPISFGEDGSFNAEVHNTGEVWATMLWEAYVALLRHHAFDDAQSRMKRYLVAGLKLTPPDPTLLEARDAMLAAAYGADQGDFQLFWEAFARRGAGVGAEGPPKDSTDNAGVVESYRVGNDAQIVEATLTDDVVSCDHDGLLDPGETGTLTAVIRNGGAGVLSTAKARLTAKTDGVVLAPRDPVAIEALAPFESTTITMPVRILEGPTASPIQLDLSVEDLSLGAEHAAHHVIATRFDADEEPNASAVDAVDTTQSAWDVPLDNPLSGGGAKWERQNEDSDGWWSVEDVPSPGDSLLMSPSFTIEGTTFGVTFRHRYWFRSSRRRQVDIDGGVVEVSTDGGKTWKDVAEVGTADYNTTLDASRSDNPLRGRKAYGNQSAGYPAWIPAHLEVSLPAHPEEVRIRFHAGTSTGFSGSAGWEVDDIALSGATSTPFFGYVAHADACDPEGPIADAGPPVTVTAGSPVTLHGTATPEDVALAFEWTQEGGPAVEATGLDSSDLSFVAPYTLEPLVLTFALRANDGALLSPASRVQVTVTAPPPRGLSAVGGGCAVRAAGEAGGPTRWSLVALGLAALAWRRRARRARA